MKSIFNRIAMALLITSLASVSAFAKTEKGVRFPADMKVNGTVVKEGVYDLKFDDKTGQVSVVKNNKVIASAAATIEKRDHKARSFALRSTGAGDELQLTGITFAGADHNVVITGSQASN